MKNILSFVLIFAISFSVNAQDVLFLDAGHGGKDPGAISANGVTEAEINQAFVSEIKDLAEAKGIQVVLLSSAKTYVSLKERVKKANKYQLEDGETAILISIHVGFSDDPTLKGREVFVMKASERSEGSLELATEVSKVLAAPIKEKGLTILREARMPAVLIEIGYISNEQDSVDLQTPDMRSALVSKIVSAIL